jgi:hypothetical protein
MEFEITIERIKSRNTFYPQVGTRFAGHGGQLVGIVGLQTDSHRVCLFKEASII